ncbi:hypothetical protein N7509_004412 [Penicillium cosmopolitanum]|uniref:Uncharacterized protein n=1 Tax=Penicillium cosmopolitanum TaxID=1131564 RepID=A0A9W9W747_9EURO|nr:uncharacterized protein N7509_004412 [Penicillium cosmopolitanum]KAJ5404541.1 hypothetical protein N7509_004412 [Penicillium cosmopolitanum]
MDIPCKCSLEALKVMGDLQNIQAVVDVETILNLTHRVWLQGNTMIQCENCIKMAQSSIVTLPALSDGCLPLLEALCAAYDISTQPGFFDSAMLAFEQPASPIICIRNQVFLGRTQLDDYEARLLVRTLLARDLIRFVELMEALKEALTVLLDGNHVHRNAMATFRACESSVESTISRLAVLMQVVEGDCDAGMS